MNTLEELQRYAVGEWSEYEENEHTRTMFPDAFDTKDEFIRAVVSASIESKKDWSKLHSWGGSINNVTPGDLDSVKEEVWGYHQDRWLSKSDDTIWARRSFDLYFDRLVEAIKAGKAPSVLIGVHTDADGEETEYVLGGNTRAMIHTALGLVTSVRKICLKGRMREPCEDGTFIKEETR